MCESLGTQEAEPLVNAIPADAGQRSLLGPASPEKQEAQEDLAGIWILDGESLVTSQNEPRQPPPVWGHSLSFIPLSPSYY